MLPWVLLVPRLIAGAWFFFLKKDKTETVAVVDNSMLIDVRENNSTVAGYVSYVNEDTSKMTLDEANKKVHTDQIDYTTFTKTKRFRKAPGVERNYELIALSHYLPDYKYLEETDADSKLYNRNEFNTDSSSQTL